MRRYLTRVGLLLGWTAMAQAQPPPPPAQADALFKRGRELMQRGELAEACASFDASQKLEPNLSTLVNLADCREKNKQLATAWELYVRAELELRDKVGASATKLRTQVTSRIDQIAPRLSMLTVTVSDQSRIEGLEIIRDNVQLPAPSWNLPVPTDGGTYHVSARAPGHREWSTTVTLRPESDAQVVDVPLLMRDSQPVDPPEISLAAEPMVEAPGHVVDDPVPAPVTAPPPRTYTLPFVLGAGALALGATAIGFERWSGRVYDESLASTDPNVRRDRWQAANTRRYVAEGLAVGAVGLAAAAVYVWIRGGRGTTDGAAVKVTPTTGTDGLGVKVGGSW